MSDQAVQTISMSELDAVTGGDFLYDAFTAVRAAVTMVKDPINSTLRGIDGYARARQQGHTVIESLANGVAQAPFKHYPDYGDPPAKTSAP